MTQEFILFVSAADTVDEKTDSEKAPVKPPRKKPGKQIIVWEKSF